jgi:hypothetical protein
MNPRDGVVAVFLLSWGCIQISAEDVTAGNGKTIKELRETVSELVARVDALEKQLAQTQVGSVAPDFAISVAKSPYRDGERRPHFQPLPAGRWHNGVDEGMRMDAIEHKIRWQRATSNRRPFGLPDDMPNSYRR